MEHKDIGLEHDAQSYYLLVNTPEGNPSRAMRHINGVHTQRFNRRHRCEGQLFRGRFKSILVEGDGYLLQLVRYIHKNPPRAGLAASLDQYRWSSHAGYLSGEEQWDWLHKRFILSILSSDIGGWRKAYLQFMEMDDGDEILRIFRGGKQPSALGAEGFVRRLKEQFFEEKIHPRVPESVALAPEIDDIKNAACAYYRVDESRLSRSRRGWFNEPRAVAIYLARTLLGARLMDIGARYRLRSHSAVSSVLSGMERQLSEDAALRGHLHEVRRKVLKRSKVKRRPDPLTDPLTMTVLWVTQVIQPAGNVGWAQASSCPPSPVLHMRRPGGHDEACAHPTPTSIGGRIDDQCLTPLHARPADEAVGVRKLVHDQGMQRYTKVRSHKGRQIEMPLTRKGSCHGKRNEEARKSPPVDFHFPSLHALLLEPGLCSTGGGEL